MSSDYTVTSSGIEFDLLEPTFKMIDIKDIAWALSGIGRFNGHSSQFYSVARHSINCSKVASPRAKFAALMHDTGEAYIGDIISPVKKLLGQRIHDIEKVILYKIFEKYKVPFDDVIKNEVNIIDWRMCVTEARILLGNVSWTGDTESYDTCGLDILNPGRSEDFMEFLDIFKQFYKEA